GLREEFWFRGLFLKKYGRFLGPLSSNVLQATVFASFHLQVQYTQFLLVFLGFTFVLGLWLGYLMKESGNILGPAIFHAGADIPIYLVFLTNLSPRNRPLGRLEESIDRAVSEPLFVAAPAYQRPRPQN